MRSFVADLRYALRGLARNPGFAAVAAATLALGIGSSVAVFGVADAVLLRPLPYRAPESLVRVGSFHPTKSPDGVGASYMDFLDWRNRSRSFENLSGIMTGSAVLGDAGSAARVPAAWVSWDLPSALGLRVAAGRIFRPDEDRDGATSAVALLSQPLWASRYGSDPSVVGRRILVEGAPHVVVGIVAGDGLVLDGAGVLLPLVEQAFPNRSGRPLDVVGRLRPGTSAAAARAEMEAIGRALQREYPESNAGFEVALRPLHESLLGDRRPALLVLAGSVAILLLIACANTANLMLARGAARRHELALRVALGAGRRRLIRQLLTEALVLASIAAGAGLVTGGLLLSEIRRLLASSAPRIAEASVDPRVAAFAVLCAAATIVLAGILPALSASHRAIEDGLRTSSRGGPADSSRTLDALILVQAALCLVLLVGAGLLGRSYLALSRADVGLEPAGVLSVRLTLPSATYPSGPTRTAFLRRTAAGAEALPGVRAAGIAGSLPGQAGMTVSYSAEGHPRLSRARSPQAEIRLISEGTLPALGIAVLEGRGISDGDREGSAPVVLVNRRLAARLWPGASALGRHVTLFSDGLERRVVGVVGDVARLDRNAQTADQLYTSFAQDRLFSGASLVLRSDADPARLAPAVERLIASLDPGVAVSDVRPLTEVLSGNVVEPRFRMVLVGGFAAAALLLAGIGLYGVIAYGVARRRAEIGIRIALGATPSSIRSLFVGRALRLAGLGTAAGIAAAIPAARLLSGLLYGVAPADPATLAASSGLLVAVAAFAALIPARRAAATNPLDALRPD